MKLKTILALAATAITCASFATTPTATAVWRSNLGQSYTIGGNTYALRIPAGTDSSGNQSSAGILNSDGTVTVTNEWTGWRSPYFQFGSDVTSISVLVKFSGFAGATDEYGACLAAMLDSSGNEVGAYVAKDATHLSAFYKGNRDNAPTQKKLDGSDEAVVGTGYLLFSYSTSGGVKVYMGSSIDGLVGGAEGSFKYGNNTITRLAIGGDADGLYYKPSGFTIEDVALFVGSSLTDSDVADYVFPTVTVDTTATMTMTELNTKVAEFGENTFNYFSASPVVTYDVAPSDATTTYLRSALWNGTVFIKDQDIAKLNPTIYGNPNSTLKLSGVSGYWGPAVYEKMATPAIELEDSETEGKEYGYFARDGYSFYSQGVYYYVHTPELKGSGTYKANATGNGALFVADKFDNFTGKLDLAGKTVWLGTGAPTKSSDTWNNQVNFPGTVRLGSAIPANYSTWTVPNGYKGTVVLTTAASQQYQVNFLTSSDWKGTCQLAWNPGNGAFDIVNYGNANSVIEIANAFGPYPTRDGGTESPNVAAEIKLSADWTISNGWTLKTTTFAKLSGAGTLTVNGNTGSEEAIPYTITRLEGFTGTIAGRRGEFTIGTIVAATEPTPGTKLVNCTTTNAPVLDSTKVVYTNVEQDVELEFKAGDGIYVKYPNVAQIGETPYVTLAAALEEVQEGQTITLLTDIALTNAVTVNESITIAGAKTISGSGMMLNLAEGKTLTLTDGVTVSCQIGFLGATDTRVVAATGVTIGVWRPNGFTGAANEAQADTPSEGWTTYTVSAYTTVAIAAENSSVKDGNGQDVTGGYRTAGTILEFYVTPNSGYILVSVTVNGTPISADANGKYSVEVGEVPLQIVVRTAYEITGETELGDGGTLEIGSATIIKIGTYDVTAGFSIDGTTATLLAPEVVEETNKKAIDVGANAVTLNVELVPGLYYGVASDVSPSNLFRPGTLTQFNGENGAAILTVTKSASQAEKGFFKVFVDIKE